MTGHNHDPGCTCGWCTGGWRGGGGGSDRAQQAPALKLLEDIGAYKSWATRFLTPNAKCPVCSEPVYYYENGFGSRVYFNDVGGDWPKHPCTDNPPSRYSFELPLKSISRRIPSESSKIEKALDDLKYHGKFFRRSGQDTTTEMYEVIAVRRKGFCNFVASIPIAKIANEPIYIAFDSAKFAPAVGAIFNFDGNICGFFNMDTRAPVKFKARAVDKEQYRAARTAIKTE